MIVDVFRAFTTAAFCFAAGAREIVLVRDHEEALAMKREDPSVFLTGEIGGRPIPGFDAGNSPSVIEKLDLSRRRVVQRTSSGTQGVAAATKAAEILLGSLVIASATARYLAKFIERTEGASPAYIKELLRNATVFGAIDGDGDGAIRVTDQHLEQAMDELAEGGRLAERIAGFTRPGEEVGPPPGAMGPSGFPTEVRGSWTVR